MCALHSLKRCTRRTQNTVFPAVRCSAALVLLCSIVDSILFRSQPLTLLKSINARHGHYCARLWFIVQPQRPEHDTGPTFPSDISRTLTVAPATIMLIVYCHGLRALKNGREKKETNKRLLLLSYFSTACAYLPIRSV